MSSDPNKPASPQPLPIASLPVAPHGHQIQARHQTVLPPEEGDALSRLDEVLGANDGGAGPAAVTELKLLCREYPNYLDGWARLGQAAYLNGDAVSAYAFGRVGYHRGLDRLRKNGWGGTGQVRWGEPGNRGFLRALHLLMVASAAIGEEDEELRCRQFLIDLDPEEGLGLADRAPRRAGELLDASELP
jgi:hypothetical protein